jgi:hypothetical protein
MTIAFSFFLLFFVGTRSTKYTFHDFREANVSVKSVDSISVLRRPQSEHPRHSPLNPAWSQITKNQHMLLVLASEPHPALLYIRELKFKMPI